jgi:hypothetical protein
VIAGKKERHRAIIAVPASLPHDVTEVCTERDEENFLLKVKSFNDDARNAGG